MLQAIIVLEYVDKIVARGGRNNGHRINRVVLGQGSSQKEEPLSDPRNRKVKRFSAPRDRVHHEDLKLLKQVVWREGKKVAWSNGNWNGRRMERLARLRKVGRFTVKKAFTRGAWCHKAFWGGGR